MSRPDYGLGDTGGGSITRGKIACQQSNHQGNSSDVKFVGQCDNFWQYRCFLDYSCDGRIELAKITTDKAVGSVIPVDLRANSG